MMFLNFKPLDKEFFKEILSKIFTARNILYFALTTGILFSGVVLFDQIIMPLYTRHGQRLRVPDVKGKRIEEAEEILKQYGLKMVKQAEKYDSRLPFGYIIDQNPRPNRNVKKGRRVYVVMSLGERDIEVPNLIGLSETNAEEILTSLGLRLGDREYQYVMNEPPDVVIWQSVSPKRMVKSGAAIDIRVSLGKPVSNIIVPSVLGKTLEAAEREIKKSGLTLGSVQYQLNDTFLPNTVIEQSLKPGLTVARGDTINLVVTTVKETGVQLNKKW